MTKRGRLHTICSAALAEQCQGRRKTRLLLACSQLEPRPSLPQPSPHSRAPPTHSHTLHALATMAATADGRGVGGCTARAAEVHTAAAAATYPNSISTLAFAAVSISQSMVGTASIAVLAKAACALRTSPRRADRTNTAGLGVRTPAPPIIVIVGGGSSSALIGGNGCCGVIPGIEGWRRCRRRRRCGRRGLVVRCGASATRLSGATLRIVCARARATLVWTEPRGRQEGAQPIEVHACNEGDDSPDDAPHKVRVYRRRVRLRLVRRSRSVWGRRRKGWVGWLLWSWWWLCLFVQTCLTAVG